MRPPSGILPCHQAVLHGEHRRRGAGGHPDLGVDVLDVAVRRCFTEMPSAFATCLVSRPRASSASTWPSRPVRPLGRSRRGTRWQADSTTAATASGMRDDLPSPRRRGLARPARPSMPARCGRCSHLVWNVSAAASGRAGMVELGGGHASVVTGPVETLVVSARDRRRMSARVRRRATAPARCGTGADAHLLPLVGGQRTGLAPRGRAHRHPAQVVHQAAPDRPGTSGIHPAARRRSRR